MTTALFTRATGGSRRVTWRSVTGIILVPLVIAGLFIWGLWSPTERMNTVQAAVVNLDEAVTLDGQLVPLGRVLASELIGNTEANNFTWTLTDEEDAAEGLADGRYATVVTIPESFSAAATSSASEPEGATQATIDIATSDRGKLIDQALSQIVTSTTTQLLNEQLATTFVENVFVGFTDLNTQLGTAADGAKLLADGGEQLADGAGELASGTEQLSTGAGALSSGAQRSADGAVQLSQGITGVNSGLGALAVGGQDLARGAGELHQGANTLASGVGEYTRGVDALVLTLQETLSEVTTTLPALQQQIGGLVPDPNTGLPAGFTSITQLVAEAQGASQAVRSTVALDPALAQLSATCRTDGIDPTFCAQVDAAITAQEAQLTRTTQELDALDAKLGGLSAQAGLYEGTVRQVSGYAGSAAGELPGLQEQLAGTEEQLGLLTPGGAGLRTGADQLAGGAGDLAGGATQLASGITAAAGGTEQLAQGAGAAAAGSQQLADGIGQLTQGLPALAAGAEALADGAEQAGTGQQELADGLGTAVHNIPNYSADERVSLATAAVTPVVAQGDSEELFNSAGVPLFAAIALWAGALASFLLLAPLWARTRDAARGVGWITARSALPALLLGALQGALVGAAMQIALGLSASSFLSFLGLSALAGVAFTLVNQGLVALFHGWGRFVSLVMLVLAFASGIVSTAPGLLTSLASFTPLAPALDGFQAIASTGASGGGAALSLMLWSLLGLTLTGAAVARERVRVQRVTIPA